MTEFPRISNRRNILNSCVLSFMFLPFWGSDALAAEVAPVVKSAKNVSLTSECAEKTTALAAPKLPDGFSPGEIIDNFMTVSGPEGMGVYSADGREIVAAKYSQLDYVGEGFFIGTMFKGDGSSDVSLINSEGRNVKTLPEWARGDLSKFREGLLDIGKPSGSSVFIDKSGKIAVVCDKYFEVDEFSEGFAAARYADRNGGWSGYIDHQGTMVIGPFQEAQLGPFHKGFAIVSEWISQGKYRAGVVAKTGSLVIPLEYETVTRLTNSEFILLKDGKLFVMDVDGRRIADFPENCVKAWVPETRSEDALIPCEFVDVNKVQKKAGRSDHVWGYCDANGKLRIEPRFAHCQEFKGNRANAFVQSTDNKFLCGVIDMSGNWVIEPKYDLVSIIDDTHYTFSPTDLTKKFEGTMYGRGSVFQDLLKTYDFIGMEKAKLAQIFGAGYSQANPVSKLDGIFESLSFSLTPGAHCGNSSRSVEFGLNQNGKVIAWRVLSGMSPENDAHPWISENVVVANDSKWLQTGNLVPKSP